MRGEISEVAQDSGKDIYQVHQYSTKSSTFLWPAHISILLRKARKESKADFLVTFAAILSWHPKQLNICIISKNRKLKVLG